MKIEEVQRLASDWIESRGKYSDAYDELDDLIQESPAAAFRVIEEIHWRICSEVPDYQLMGYLAAGPLEDLLSYHGERVIGDVEALAKEDPEFRKCLAGVWQNDMEDEMYARVQKAADSSWKFT